MSQERGTKLFLCGDVMTGRGIDQILQHPSDPRLYEPYLRSAIGYVELAEQVNGPIPRRVDHRYIWGDALEILNRMAPQARIVNLETAVTTCDEAWPGKGINYRMHPANLPCLNAAGIDCCVLANNHVMDWGYGGLAETLSLLRQGGLRPVGAGEDFAAAQAPAAIPLPGGGRVLVIGCASTTSGVLPEWAARAGHPGVNLLPDLSRRTAVELRSRCRGLRQPGDFVVVSIHWGSNWGYAIAPEQTAFARCLVEEGDVDVVHGHSSHHVRALEVHKGKLILYGCGDFLNDYEGIGGYENFRGDLAIMYFPTLDDHSGDLRSLEMVPTTTRRFQIHRADESDALWLKELLSREGRRFGFFVDLAPDHTLKLRW